MWILEIASDNQIEVVVEKASAKKLPLKKDGWNFNWRKQFKEIDTETYILQIRDTDKIQGVVQLKTDGEMLLMNVVEVAPWNIGKRKIYDKVAGILIAFSCRESFKLESDYRGFLTFVSKSSLIKLYQKKYGATQALGQRMYIDPEQGLKLIKEYIDTK